jgi:hypothetical protein
MGLLYRQQSGGEGRRKRVGSEAKKGGEEGQRKPEPNDGSSGSAIGEARVLRLIP